jgi:hypothetical protein
MINMGPVTVAQEERLRPGTVYVTVDAHRLNDFKTYMWVSNDFGATFRSMNANLSAEVVKTLTEDTKNPDVLYIGAETGLFATLDRGKSWRRIKGNLPTVRIDEITIHPRDNAMIIGTHGRSIWILDHLEPIQEYAAALVPTSGSASSIERFASCGNAVVHSKPASADAPFHTPRWPRFASANPRLTA